MKRFGRSRGVAVVLDQTRGKGSHATLYYGARRTVVKDRRKEIGSGLLNAMLSQLGLTKKDIGL
ncbi:MAG: type II toxin-antitoxin system HicA family toxin [Alphaproteobacteria bacterium]|nr:type II toxin-antitoxin system HicA family toxin [Alphaproteobacteria bacterium]